MRVLKTVLIAMVVCTSALVNAAATGGESRAFTPIKDLEQAPGHATFGVGPGFGGGMNSDAVMYSLAGGYVWDFDRHFSAKAIAEADLGSGRDVARMLDVAVGADAYLTQDDFLNVAKPYVTADVGIGSARNNNNDANTGVTVGGGAGLRFSSKMRQHMDLQAHFKLLTAQVASTNPSVFGVRASINF